MAWFPTQQLCQYYNWLRTRCFSVQKLKCGQSWYEFEDPMREHRKFTCRKVLCKRFHNKLVTDSEEFFLLLSPSLLQVPNHKHGSVLVSQNSNCLDTKQKLSESHNDLEGLMLLHHGSLKKGSVLLGTTFILEWLSLLTLNTLPDISHKLAKFKPKHLL